MYIKEITSLATLSVRHPVLRAGKPIDSYDFEGDDLSTTKHFGIFESDNLRGVISIFKNNHIYLTTQIHTKYVEWLYWKIFRNKGLAKS